MNEIEREIERRKIEYEIARIENERIISRLAMERHLAMLKANQTIMKDRMFESVVIGLVAWSFVLLICIMIMLFLPLCNK